MKRTGFATVLVAAVTVTASVSTPAFARDDGPRFVQDRLDALVAQHAQANRHIARDAHHAAASKGQHRDDAS
jgi:hypothetical protein